MSVYECNENQFVENVRRLLDSGRGFVVNRRITMRDDHKYGLATIPDREFAKYDMICERNGFKRTVYARVPFLDDFRGRLYSAGDALHSSSSLNLPRVSLPYERVEYSFNLWGSTYLHTFDAMFEPEVVLEKKNLQARMRKTSSGSRRATQRRRSSMLVHVLKFNPPDERLLALNLPRRVLVLDVKKMSRIFDA